MAGKSRGYLPSPVVTCRYLSLPVVTCRYDSVSNNRRSMALQVRQLRKTFKDVVAVDGIDLDVQPGECFGLLGPNGAGKTTTIEICEGLTEPDSGEVKVLGRTWRSDTAWLRQKLGIQLQ